MLTVLPVSSGNFSGIYVLRELAYNRSNKLIVTIQIGDEREDKPITAIALFVSGVQFTALVCHKSLTEGSSSSCYKQFQALAKRTRNHKPLKWSWQYFHKEICQIVGNPGLTDEFEKDFDRASFSRAMEVYRVFLIERVFPILGHFLW